MEALGFQDDQNAVLQRLLRIRQRLGLKFRSFVAWTPAKKYVRNLAKNLLHTEVTAAREAGTAPAATTEQAAQQTVPLMLVAATLTDVRGEAACHS